MNEKKKQEIPIPFKLDDFFTTQETRDDEQKEKVESIDISLIDDFKEHPFKVIENDELKALEESINTSGVLSPVIVRKKDDGRYEMISGHRRKFACNKLGIDKIPCLVKDLTDDEATIFMVDSNLQREKLLPSEKAFAYKMKMEALNHQGRTYQPQDDTSRPMVDKLKSADIMGEEVGESGRQIQRYIRLTELIPELLQLVDDEKMKLRPAVEISYLTKSEQEYVFEAMEYNEVFPSHPQARELKKLSTEGKLTDDEIDRIMSEEKPNQKENIKFSVDKVRGYFPKEYTPTEMQNIIVKLLENYQLKWQKEKELKKYDR